MSPEEVNNFISRCEKATGGEWSIQSIKVGKQISRWISGGLTSTVMVANALDEKDADFVVTCKAWGLKMANELLRAWTELSQLRDLCNTRQFIEARDVDEKDRLIKAFKIARSALEDIKKGNWTPNGQVDEVNEMHARSVATRTLKDADAIVSPALLSQL